MHIKHFVNLTNGLEFIHQLPHYEFIRIQSSTIEQKNWFKLFSDLDNNFLMNLVIGNKCIVYDCGTNRKMSKTIYLGVPMINYVLSKFFDLELPPAIRYSRTGLEQFNETTFYNSIYDNLFNHNCRNEKLSLKHKLKYYKKFINCTKIKLTGISVATTHDGDYAYYSNLLNQHNKNNQTLTIQLV